MKFNVEKLKSVARPMTQDEMTALDFLSDNADWLRLSAAIALKIRKILRQKGMQQAELANLLSVTPAQVSKFLSGKVNFELKTIAKIQSVLGEQIVEVPLQDKLEEAADQHANNQFMVFTQFIKSEPIVSTQKVGAHSYFSVCNTIG